MCSSLTSVSYSYSASCHDDNQHYYTKCHNFASKKCSVCVPQSLHHTSVTHLHANELSLSTHMYVRGLTLGNSHLINQMHELKADNRDIM